MREILSRDPPVPFEVESEVQIVPAEEACDRVCRYRSGIEEGVSPPSG